MIQNLHGVGQLLKDYWGHNVSIRLVENEEFRELIHKLDKRYKIIEEVFVDLKANLKLYLKDAKSVNICGDIWTSFHHTSSLKDVTVSHLQCVITTYSC